MSFRKFTIWLLILVALGSYFYFFEMKGSKEERKKERNIKMEALSMLSPEEIREKIKKEREKEEKEKELKKVFTFKEDDVKEIKLIKDNQTIFYRKDDGEWKIIEPIKARRNDEAINSLISSLASLVEIRVIEENPSDLGEYGLKEPYAEVSIEVRDDPSPKTLLIGSYNPNATCIYAKIKNSPLVFLVGSFIKFELDMTFYRLIDKE